MTPTEASPAPLLPPGLDLVVRLMKPTDHHHVIHTWLRTFADSGEVLSNYDHKDDYYADYHPIVERAVIQGAEHFTIACLRSEPDAIVAWSFIEMFPDEPAILHYVHVKPRLRNIHVMRWFLNDWALDRMLYTHSTLSWRKISHPKQWAYRPLLKWRTQCSKLPST